MTQSRNPETDDPVEILQDSVSQALRPFERFIEDQRSSSLFLLGATVVALAIANSDWSDSYSSILHWKLGFFVEEQSFALSISHWINDGLMALFFFLLGFEIKREILTGELDSPETLIPVVAAALGGMLLPATIFLFFTAGTPYSSGWGIPMATDAAFAIGILAMLGKSVPKSASAFLVALAIIDDLGAILVIAVFYSESVVMAYLIAGLVMAALLFVLNLAGIRSPFPYLLLGIGVWIAFLNSGIHATIAGVLVALTIPTRVKESPGWLAKRFTKLTSRFKKLEAKRESGAPLISQSEQLEVIRELQETAEKASPLLVRLEHSVEPPVALIVVPLFALANAGVPLAWSTLADLPGEPLALGIFFGLLLGKGIGIGLLSWIAVKTRIGKLPDGLGLQQVVGLGLLGGIGFTMSIFIANLGFESDPALIVIAKTAVLLASLVAGISGYLWLRYTSRNT